jgi:hypothetical protein
MKMRPLGAELFHTDRRTDITKLTATFRNFANAPIQAGRPGKISPVGKQRTYRPLLCDILGYHSGADKD